MKNGFFRGHGLGNDYVVIDPKDLSFSLTAAKIKTICDRNWGLGSDGILALVLGCHKLIKIGRNGSKLLISLGSLQRCKLLNVRRVRQAGMR